jgi:hypothetical protein
MLTRKHREVFITVSRFDRNVNVEVRNGLGELLWHQPMPAGDWAEKEVSHIIASWPSAKVRDVVISQRAVA